MKIGMNACVVIALGLAAGCAGRPSLLPNSDESLRKTSAQFAADAAKRHPYKGEAPRGGDALATVQYNPAFARFDILNYSDQDWHDVELWINQNYVVYIPKLEKDRKSVESLPFQMLYDDSGNYFTTDGGKTPVRNVEVFHDGKMYTVAFKMEE